jgi:hypothetical protein
MHGDSKIKLKNLTTSLQQVVVNGVSYELPMTGVPGSVKTFAAEIAEAFINKYGFKEVAVLSSGEANNFAVHYANKDTVWVANMTGNPTAEKMVRTNRKNEHGQLMVIEVENPAYLPKTIKRSFDMGQRPIDAGSYPAALNLATVEIKIEPYERLELPANIGRWFLGRQRASGPLARLCVIKSRAPTQFEPDSSWTIDDLRIYLRAVDRHANIGKREATIRAEVEAKLGKDDAAGIEQALIDAKDALIKQLFFKVVDPEVRLPTYAEFQALREAATGNKAPKQEASDAAELVKQSMAQTKKAMRASAG